MRSRFASQLLYPLAGIVLIIAAFATPSLVLPMIISTTVVVSVIPIAYSYFIWKQETSRASDS